MWATLPPLGLFQTQTLGGVYSGVSVIPEAPGVLRARGRSCAAASCYTISRASRMRCAPNCRADGVEVVCDCPCPSFPQHRRDLVEVPDARIHFHRLVEAVGVGGPAAPPHALRR